MEKFTKVSEYVLDVKVGDIFKVGGMTYAVTAVGESNNVKATYCKVEGTPDRKKSRQPTRLDMWERSQSLRL